MAAPGTALGQQPVLRSACWTAHGPRAWLGCLVGEVVARVVALLALPVLVARAALLVLLVPTALPVLPALVQLLATVAARLVLQLGQ